jgi:hypothetical protein
MYDDESGRESFDEMVRSIARKVGETLERAAEQVDLDEFAGSVGVDPERAREWVESAGSWLRGQAELLGNEVAFRAAAGRAAAREQALRAAAPHPLDLPTEEQGLALAAVDSGRWAVEPGTDALTTKGDGPSPSEAPGVVRELRVRDWIVADGELTLVGRHALSRWLDSATGGR